MGKKTQTKITSKKKPASKTAAEVSASPKKKADAGASTAPAKSAKKPAAKKANDEKSPSPQNILKRQFDRVVPDVLYTVPPDKISASVFTAPPFVSPENADRVKTLLRNTYTDADLKAAAENPPAPPVSRSELIKRQFDREVPASLYTVPPDKISASVFTAPPFVSPENADRIKALLRNIYTDADLKAAAEKAEAEKIAAEKAAAEKAEAERIAAEKAAAEKAEAERIAAEKAAAEKAEAERIAAEKAAAEKAEAERIAAEKAAAEKAEAERIAAEKAAAEKAEAERIAAEKAAAEKAEAERIAAEKAAAEKAEAERIAAEKAAAEKAEAERIAAEKAAAEKAEAERIAAEKARQEAAMWKNRLPFDPSDPTNRAIMAVAASLFLVMIILVWASVSNSGKYYAIEKKGALQIWKGEFAPLGKKRIATLPGVPLPEPAKAIYCADDLYPLAFAHYMDNADALRAVPGIPDFEGIKSSLKSALSFSTTEAMRREAMDRLDTIDRTALTYRADEAARQGTIEGFNTAIALLAESAQLTTDKAEKDIINQRIAGHKASIVRLTAASTETAGAP